MLIYWILFVIPVVTALIVRPRDWPGFHTSGQGLVALCFATLYVVVSFARFEVGSDWYAYEAMYGLAAGERFAGAFGITDPLFSFLLWVSASLDAGIYPLNAFCSLVLVAGVMRVCAMTREPWLALTASVPYLLIVVGFGYVRQAAAIGFFCWRSAPSTGANPSALWLCCCWLAAFTRRRSCCSRSLGLRWPIATSLRCLL
jgi:hypothetical protein